jgi:hypothetical protein
MTRKQPIWWAVGALIGFSIAHAIEGPGFSLQPTQLSRAPRQVRYADFPQPNPTYQIAGSERLS